MCPPTNEWLEKMWFISEYYSAMRKKEILQFATTWVDLEGICYMKEARQRKANTAWYHLYVESSSETVWKSDCQGLGLGKTGRGL